MNSIRFANFQVGMVDDPSVEHKGGFEYASGMDIFSEPGVIKASFALAEVTYGTGATPIDVPRWSDDKSDSTSRMYVVAGDKILESTNGTTFNLFLTNANGAILGMRIFDGYVYYASATKLGRAPVGNGAAKDDNFQTLDSDTEFHPMELQAGGLKIGAGRYVANVAEGGTFTAQALKLPVGYRIKSLASHLLKLYAGTKFGTGLGATTFGDASVFDWNGIPLSSGSALPGTPYPIKMRAMHALLSDGGTLYGFPDSAKNLYFNDGVTFRQLRQLQTRSITLGEVEPGAVCQHLDTILWGGTYSLGGGVMQMKSGAVCQAFVPSFLTPGGGGTVNIGFVRSAFNGQIYIGLYDGNTYHIEKTSSNRQNNAVIQTLWHKCKTANTKRFAGVQLHLKPLGNCEVTVHYRTERNGSWIAAPYVIDEDNQHSPLLFRAQPRDVEIQFKFTFTTSTTTTPELIGYEPLFEVLSSTR